MKRAAVAVSALLAFAGCGGEAQPATTSAPGPKAFSVAVTVEVPKVGLKDEQGDPCMMTGGYSDINAGAQVKILDDSGKVVALGELGGGTAVEKFEGVPGTEYCGFEALVEGVPLMDLFGVEVSHRGVVNFKRDGDPTKAALVIGG